MVWIWWVWCVAGVLQLKRKLPNNLPTTPLGTLEYLDACGLAAREGQTCLVIGETMTTTIHDT
jgi:hypothetical protein